MIAIDAAGLTRFCGALALLASLVFWGCAPAGDNSETVTEAISVAPGEGTAGPAGLDRAWLDDATRSEKDREQDAARRALDVYEWLGIVPGMVVADVFASDGYNTHLLSRAAGEEGQVYAVMEFYDRKDLFDGRIYRTEALRERIDRARLDNVVLLSRLSDLPTDEIEAALVVRNYHDVEWVFPELTREHVLGELLRALVPGGVVGVVDVATHHEGWHEETHRLNESVVVDDFTGVGFELEARSDMLANPADDHTTPGFEEGRYGMDRYLLKFRKPSAP